MGDGIYDWSDSEFSNYLREKKEWTINKREYDIKSVISEHFGGVDYEKLAELAKREFPENFI